MTASFHSLTYEGYWREARVGGIPASSAVGARRGTVPANGSPSIAHRKWTNQEMDSAIRCGPKG